MTTALNLSPCYSHPQMSHSPLLLIQLLTLLDCSTKLASTITIVAPANLQQTNPCIFMCFMYTQYNFTIEIRNILKDSSSNNNYLTPLTSLHTLKYNKSSLLSTYCKDMLRHMIYCVGNTILLMDSSLRSTHRNTCNY